MYQMSSLLTILFECKVWASTTEASQCGHCLQQSFSAFYDDGEGICRKPLQTVMMRAICMGDNNHEDIAAIWAGMTRIWKPIMMTSSMEIFFALLAICAGNPVNSPHKGQWRGALMFSMICVWINDWANNREAGDLRRYRAHYDARVMMIFMMTWDNKSFIYVFNGNKLAKISHSRRINSLRPSDAYMSQ